MGVLLRDDLERGPTPADLSLGVFLASARFHASMSIVVDTTLLLYRAG